MLPIGTIGKLNKPSAPVITGSMYVERLGLPLSSTRAPEIGLPVEASSTLPDTGPFGRDSISVRSACWSGVGAAGTCVSDDVVKMMARATAMRREIEVTRYSIDGNFI
jgi:hypothetical protein